MYTKSQVEYIKAITPIHAGTGQDLGIADMPIQREKHSNIPKIEASSLKGSIKSYLFHEEKGEDKENRKLFKIFGSENGNEASSLISFTDAKLLLFPIKSIADIFKLITCPYILKRWVEDLKLINNTEKDYEFIHKLNVADGYAVPLVEERKIVLEEYVFNKECSKTEDKEKLKKLFSNIKDVNLEKIIILSDSDFRELVTLHTEIITRNKIDTTTGVAEAGGLFTEEYLPSESILYFVVLEALNLGENKEGEAIEYYNNMGNIFQIGGNFTIGKGFVKRLSEESGKNGNK